MNTNITEDEWPDVIVELETHEEYGRISEAVGELTSALLDCKFKGLMVSSISRDLRNYLSAVLLNLEESI